jgi:hypothetical protein
MYFRSWSISGVQAPVSIESEHNIHILKPEWRQIPREIWDLSVLHSPALFDVT